MIDLQIEAADAAVEIDRLVRGEGYHDATVQAMARRLDAMAAEIDVPDTMLAWPSTVVFLADLVKAVGRPVPERLPGLVVELRVLVEALRNVGSRGAENAQAMRDLCSRLSDLAGAEAWREHRERYADRGCFRG